MQNRRYSRKHKQRGGSPNVAFDSAVIKTAAGAPLEIWSSSDAHCGDFRPAPQLGGRRSQRGGGCGCMGTRQVGGSSGNGGFSTLLSNANGKFPEAYVPGACPAPQVGGGLIQSYPAGYSMGDAYQSPSSTFFEPKPYGRHCMGGGTRYTRKRLSQRRSRNRNRNRNRKHH